MKTNDLIIITLVQEHKGLMIDVDEILKPQLECCIYKVLEYLHKANEEAYTHKVISMPSLSW